MFGQREVCSERPFIVGAVDGYPKRAKVKGLGDIDAIEVISFVYYEGFGRLIAHYGEFGRLRRLLSDMLAVLIKGFDEKGVCPRGVRVNLNCRSRMAEYRKLTEQEAMDQVLLDCSALPQLHLKFYSPAECNQDWDKGGYGVYPLFNSILFLNTRVEILFYLRKQWQWRLIQEYYQWGDRRKREPRKSGLSLVWS